jgi:hypothetical protein
LSKTKELLTLNKEQTEAKDSKATAVLEEPEKEQDEEKLFYSAPIKIGLAASPEPPPFNSNSNDNKTINFLQRSYGNLSTLRYFNYPIQPKLKIGRPDDIYEQEADRIAEQVMRMPEKESVSVGNKSTIQTNPT